MNASAQRFLSAESAAKGGELVAALTGNHLQRGPARLPRGRPRLGPASSSGRPGLLIEIPLLVVCAACGLWAGCGPDSRAVVRAAQPLNRATAVGVGTKPMLSLSPAVRIDATDRKVLLDDVTGGTRRTVAGTVVIEGADLTYEPVEVLASGHDFELVIEEGAVSGSDFDLLDGSEWPAEPLSWPYRLRFSTLMTPRVRGAYQERLDGRSRITVRFSQPMNPLSTGSAIEVRDAATSSPLPLAELTWGGSDGSTVRLFTAVELGPAQLYELFVSRQATSSGGVELDGDEDGNPGRAGDDVVALFTGAQTVIISRLRND